MSEAGRTREADTTARIRGAALELFSETGYGSVTVDEIARRAGVGVATLYRRWPDKAALANDLFASILADMGPLYEDDIRAPTQRQRFLALWRRTWHYAQSHPNEFLFIESHVHAAFISAENQRTKDQLGERAAALLTDLGIGADAGIATAMIIGTTAALLQGGQQPDPDEIGQRFWTALRPG